MPSPVEREGIIPIATLSSEKLAIQSYTAHQLQLRPEGFTNDSCAPHDRGPRLQTADGCLGVSTRRKSSQKMTLLIKPTSSQTPG